MSNALVVQLATKINAAPEHVWEVMSSVAGLGEWLGPKTYEPYQGGRILFDVLHEGQRWLMFGNVVAWQPAERLAFTWQEFDAEKLTCWPFPTTVSIELRADSGGTLVTLRHSGFEKLPDGEEQYRSYQQGWESLNDLAKLAEMCEAGQQAQ